MNTSPLDDGLRTARVLVTGAAGGIGDAVVRQFSSAGSQIVASDLDLERLAPLRRLDGVTTVLAADLADPDACQRLPLEAADALGGLDVVAHIAGVLRRRPDLDAITEDDWDAQHDTNLKGSFFLLRSAARHMVRQGRGGRIVAVASQGWWTGGYAGSIVYSATKGGLVSLCRGLARVYGPAQITVNTVAPGAIETRMLTTGLSDQTAHKIVSATPLGRLGRSDEVAATVLFLASHRASFITAATINVSGGWLTY